ncbi:MAG: ABC transporter ATP-binding protein [Deltaproteobacteria bacterium]|nr:ABC transporter ATP-binding protein [Deltaproteobacteria bacterium]MBI3079737.1 ABC transporter ATP-binding protein [Deltaproteobacteria bacterium]
MGRTANARGAAGVAEEDAARQARAIVRRAEAGETGQGLRHGGPVVRLTRVTKRYRMGAQSVTALRGVNLEIPAGDFLAVVGPSGCGKSTLLNLIGAIDLPTDGEVWVDGRDLARLSDRELTALRRERIGIVYQFFNLLPHLSAWENVALPLLLNGLPAPEVRVRVDRQLEQVGLGHRATHWPHELSGGEMQRVAIARAVITAPALLLADEPTGNLDTQAGEEVMQLLRAQHAGRGQTIVVATHSPDVARWARHIVHLRDGAIAGIEEPRAPLA